MLESADLARLPSDRSRKWEIPVNILSVSTSVAADGQNSYQLNEISCIIARLGNVGAITRQRNARGSINTLAVTNAFLSGDTMNAPTSEISPPTARLLTFRELFNSETASDAGSYFEIPDFQRSYAWETKQRQDLISDIENLYRKIENSNKDSGTVIRHFCGMIICTQSSDGKVLQIVDGQQRITSLVLLYSIMKKHGAKSSLPQINFYPQEVDRTFFSRLVEGLTPGAPQTQGQKIYLQARNEFKQWVVSQPQNLDKIIKVIENNLHFIVFSLSDMHEVSKVFETVNNRGKPLAQLDLVKNHLMFLEGEHGWKTRSVKGVWTTILETISKTRFIGSETIDTVLNAVVSAMYNPRRRKAGESDFQIVGHYVNKKCQFEKFLDFLECSFRAFQLLRSSTDAGSGKFSRVMTHLNAHPSVNSALPLVFAAFFRTDENEQLEDKFLEDLEAIEKANFRLYGLLDAAKRSDSYDIPLNILANKIFESKIKLDSAVPMCLPDELSEIVRNAHPNGVEQIVQALTLDDGEPVDFYKWSALKYFLARWEEDQLTNQSFNWPSLFQNYKTSKSNDYLSVEHIIPQKDININSFLYEYNKRHLIRRLGNFILIPHGVNIQLSNSTLDAKLNKLELASQNVVGLQVHRIQRFIDQAKVFVGLLENRKIAKFDPNTNARRFNKPTRDKNHAVAIAKTLCDVREESMVRFALRSWVMKGEQEQFERTSFRGILSFSHDGVAYRSDLDSRRSKTNENYLIDDGPLIEKRSEMLKARNDVLGSYTSKNGDLPLKKT